MRWLSRLKPRMPRGERGQSFVFIVLLLPILLGISALGIDVGGWYTQSRKAQSIADAAALSAAGWLRPDDTDPYGDAILAGQTSLATNVANEQDPLHSATADITPGFGGDPLCVGPHQTECVQVVVNTSAHTYFAKMFGFGSVDVQKTAVATRAERDIKVQIFAYGECDSTHGNDNGFLLKDSGLNVDGGIISNGQFTIDGSNNVAGAAVQYIGKPGAPPTGKKKPKATGCLPDISGSGNGFPSPQSLPTADPNIWAWPMIFTPSQFPCTYSSPFEYTDSKGKKKSSDDLIVDADHGFPDGSTLPSGTYCVDGKVKILSDNISGDVTFLSDGKIEVYGKNANFTANANDVVFFACKDFRSGTCGWEGEMHLSGDNLHWTGIAYAPEGGIEIGEGGSDEDKESTGMSCTNCLAEGWHVKILAPGFSMHGTPAGDPLQPVGLVKLIQ